MADLIPQIEKTSKLVQEISAASVEQNSGADQVNSAIQQLNNVTQQNAASSEELATSAEEMASQADQLKDTMSFFNVDKQSRMSSGTGIQKVQNQDFGQIRRSHTDLSNQPEIQGHEVDSDLAEKLMSEI